MVVWLELIGLRRRSSSPEDCLVGLVGLWVGGVLCGRGVVLLLLPGPLGSGWLCAVCGLPCASLCFGCLRWLVGHVPT